MRRVFLFEDEAVVDFLEHVLDYFLGDVFDLYEKLSVFGDDLNMDENSKHFCDAGFVHVKRGGAEHAHDRLQHQTHHVVGIVVRTN